MTLLITCSRSCQCELRWTFWRSKIKMWLYITAVQKCAKVISKKSCINHWHHTYIVAFFGKYTAITTLFWELTRIMHVHHHYWIQDAYKQHCTSLLCTLRQKKQTNKQTKTSLLLFLSKLKITVALKDHFIIHCLILHFSQKCWQ